MSAVVTQMTPRLLQQGGVGAEGHQPVVDSTAILLGVEDVIVADRFRKELGDVSDLVESIVQVGLLNPITVEDTAEGYRLIAGERRLTAYRKLGLAEIPARVAEDISDARDALVAERDENTARKEMLPSEKAALAMALEEMEKPAAKERQLSALNKGDSRSVPGNGTGHDSREVAAEAVDLRPSTYTRLKTLVNLSTDEEQPAEVQEAARDALDEIDRGSPIRRGYDKVKEIRRKSESVTVEATEQADGRATRSEEIAAWHHALAKKYPTPRLAFDAEGHERHATLESFKNAAVSRYGAEYRFTEPAYAKHSRTSQQWLENASESIEVSLDVFSNIDWETITPEQAGEALQRIDTSSFNFFIKTLKGIANG